MSYYLGRQNFTPAALDTALHILASATVRCHLCEVVISSDATPVEQTGEHQIVRTTSTGTTPAGNTTVVKRDTFSPTAGCTFGGGGYGTEPTFTDVLMDICVHQKNTFRWNAYPGRELISAPTASCGIGVTVVQQSAAFSANYSCMWLE